MTFEKWWEKNGAERGDFETYGQEASAKNIAQKLWNEWQATHDNTIDRLRTEFARSIAYSKTLKRVSETGCKKRGRCVSKKVNEDYCVVCRPIFNVLFEFGRTNQEVLEAIFATECPDCKGLGSPDPSDEVGGLPDPPCPTCKGVGSIYPEDES
jgi:hypothetical protein